MALLLMAAKAEGCEMLMAPLRGAAVSMEGTKVASKEQRKIASSEPKLQTKTNCCSWAANLQQSQGGYTLTNLLKLIKAEKKKGKGGWTGIAQGKAQEQCTPMPPATKSPSSKTIRAKKMPSSSLSLAVNMLLPMLMEVKPLSKVALQPR